MSIVRDRSMYEKHEQIVLVHGVRFVDGLACHDLLTRRLASHGFLGDMLATQMRYDPTVTREEFQTQGRIPDPIAGGRLFADLGLPVIDPAHDRVMICASPRLLRELRPLFEGRGFEEGNTSTPGGYVIKRAFVEQ